MAHEITSTDHVALYRKAAWHGLGTIVEQAPTPQEALKIARLDWDVEQWPISATNGEVRVALADHFANIRSDTRDCLGVVGKGYSPIQNRELADFAAALAEQGDAVKVETAGSIRGGAKVWFLLRGESFSVRGGDEVAPYILVSNGHDGGTALRCTPTTIRVVCSNTLHAVIPQNGRGRLKAAGYVARHSGSMSAKIEEAKAALRLYGHAIAETRGVIDQLAARDVDSEIVRRFFLESYARDFGAIPDVAVTKTERSARDRALRAYSAYDRRFQKEESQFGASLWLAVNAYTGWLQHDRTIRIKDASARREQRLGLTLFGDDAERSTAALQAALAV